MSVRIRALLETLADTLRCETSLARLARLGAHRTKVPLPASPARLTLSLSLASVSLPRSVVSTTHRPGDSQSNATRCKRLNELVSPRALPPRRRVICQTHPSSLLGSNGQATETSCRRRRHCDLRGPSFTRNVAASGAVVMTQPLPCHCGHIGCITLS